MIYIYQYKTLLYRHNPISGECVAVGVLVHCAEARHLGIKVVSDTRMLKSMYDNFDETALRAVQEAVKKMAFIYFTNPAHRSRLNPLAMELTNVRSKRPVLP